MQNKQEIINEIDNKLFDIFWDSFKHKDSINKNFIKKVFLSVDSEYKKIISDTNINTALFKNVGVHEMVNYIVAEHLFHLSLVNYANASKIENDDNYFKALVKICLDKLIINELNDVDARNVISKYSVEVSLLTMFINKMFYLLSSFNFEEGNSKKKLECDILAKCLMLIKSTLQQLCDGLETEALSSWRTCHELLCVLCIINKSDVIVSEAYYRHLTYGAYTRNEITDEKQIKEIEESIAKDMEALKVKKSNKEKFINYGWIHWAYKEYNGEEVKMNFLGGLQKVAELSKYRKYYEIASDVTHSTPLLVYANKKYLTDITLKITYETFFKLDSLLYSIAENEFNLKPNNANFAAYIRFKNNYKTKIELIYSKLNKK